MNANDGNNRGGTKPWASVPLWVIGCTLFLIAAVLYLALAIPYICACRLLLGTDPSAKLAEEEERYHE